MTAAAAKVKWDMVTTRKGPNRGAGLATLKIASNACDIDHLPNAIGLNLAPLDL
jgi:hypothetical protein